MVADRLHADTCQHTYRLVDSLKSTRQSQRIDARGKHTHLVTFHTVKTALRTAQTAEDVATANHDSHLHALLRDGFDLFGVLMQTLGIYTETLLALQTLTRELQ